MLKIDAQKWQKRVLHQLLIYLFLGLMLAFGGYGVMSATLAAPENPMTTQKADVDQNPDTLVSDAQENDAVYIPLTVKSQNDSNSEELTKTDDGLSNEPDQADPSSSPSEKNSSRGTGHGGVGGGDNPNASKTTEDYFSTSIKDGEQLSSTTYPFTITHNITSLKVKAIHVIVNTVEIIQFNGTVQLKEGENSIVVMVDYEDANGTVTSPYKSYTVYVDTKNLIIDTDLKDQTVTEGSFSFNALAKYQDTAVNLTVTFNGKEITGNDGKYSVFLKAGENKFVLTAKIDNLPRENSYTVTYQDSGTFKISTNLVDQETSKDAVTFQVRLENDGGSGVPTVKLNESKLQPTENADGIYTYTATNFHVGANEVRITARNDDGSATPVTRTITYSRQSPSEGNLNPYGEKGPTIEANIVDGATVTNSIYTLKVKATSYLKKHLFANNIVVEFNGTTVSNGWEDSEYTSYRLNLVPGQNKIMIKVTDDDQYSQWFPFTITYTPTEGPIGTITVSLEASTVGLGYLIEPVSVEIYDKETFATAFDKLVADYGFTYEHSGSMTDSFYLSRVAKTGMAVNAEIPGDLLETLEKGGEMSTGKHDPNSLGERDFYEGAGWMYSINGKYPNWSFADYYPANGDVVRIRFTLAKGKDVGGDVNGGGNYNKEW